jgi:hypothetical protein
MENAVIPKTTGPTEKGQGISENILILRTVLNTFLFLFSTRNVDYYSTFGVY